MSESENQVLLSDFIEYSHKEMAARSVQNYLQLKRRHSIRDFSNRDVPKEVIENCIRAAGTAPSGANHQPWHFVAIKNPDLKGNVRQAAEELEQSFYQGRAGQEWLDALRPLGTSASKPYLDNAPWLIAVFSQKRGGMQNDGEQTNYYVHESVGIATGFLIQALHHAGLGTLTHTPKPMSFLSAICGRDNAVDRPYMLIVTGYPSQEAIIPSHATYKKSLDEIATFLE
ncbi:nitroreductase family protein [Vibrio ostreicida]|uniref:Nitroreductase family protein n=1 Tax=Vibrio ostreicida TaxID=526588 RepID=A0ABT8BNV2_9VIBR|nr:nitroreductase family protein [Vibrio ostreicida]MDN3608442.1 nitroreductase family protein [Vibrio ostreicida]MDN3611092.1 nitroreductase family protein [Vibrio ostreicida]NPD10263.1 nitroreductase family protein [Vibrio ostreicida]